jgi:alpha-glucoside transport system substrate-binding protein
MKKALVLLLCLVAAAGLFAGGQKDGAAAKAAPRTVSVLTVWGGQELDAFLELVAPFTERTGITIEHEGTRDINAVLTTRVQAGNPPDVAGLPGPGQMADLSRRGALVDLSTVFDMNQMRQDYNPGWLEMATVDGKLAGIFIKSSVKGLVWYNVKFVNQNGIPLPKTWDETMEVSRAIANRGLAPWAIGVESGAASGWVGTDWIENIFLKLNGPEAYVSWYKGDLAWTSPEMRRAWELFGQIVGDRRMIYGGPQYVLATNFGNAQEPLFQNPPQAVFHHQASFITSFITTSFPNLQPVTDFDFFAFPSINDRYARAIVTAGDLFGMLNDTEPAKEFIRFLASTDAQTRWVQLSGSLSANQSVPVSAYSDPITRKSAEVLQGAESVVFDASDMMPEQMNNAFWSGILRFIENPANLDTVLRDLERVRQEAYRR